MMRDTLLNTPLAAYRKQDGTSIACFEFLHDDIRAHKLDDITHSGIYSSFVGDFAKGLIFKDTRTIYDDMEYRELREAWKWGSDPEIKQLYVWFIRIDPMENFSALEAHCATRIMLKELDKFLNQSYRSGTLFIGSKSHESRIVSTFEAIFRKGFILNFSTGEHTKDNWAIGASFYLQDNGLMQFVPIPLAIDSFGVWKATHLSRCNASPLDNLISKNRNFQVHSSIRLSDLAQGTFIPNLALSHFALWGENNTNEGKQKITRITT